MNEELPSEDVERLALATMQQLSKKAISFYQYKFRCITESEYAMVLTGGVDHRKVNKVFHFLHLKPAGTQFVDKKYFGIIESYLKKDVDSVSKDLEGKGMPLRILTFHIDRIVYTPSETVDHLVTVEVSGVYLPIIKG